jgi:hypothetical protein
MHGSEMSINASAATTIVLGPVERAFAAVRLVEANVCAGGAWLAQSTVSKVIAVELAAVTLVLHVVLSPMD